jgi:spermidine synthase
VEAAGSSLLYAKEFYDVAKQRLNTNGILQAWFPGGEIATLQAVVRSVTESFPCVRCFSSLGKWGTHILASMEPIDSLTDEQLAAKFPEAASRDLLEWSQASRSSVYLGEVLSQELATKDLLAGNPRIRITDDHPFNEYYFLRRAFRSSADNPNP